MVPEVSFIVDASTQPSSSLRKRRAADDDERHDMLNAGNEFVIPNHSEPQKTCSPCHFSCLKCRGPNDYDCTACAPDSKFTKSGDAEAYCYPPAKGHGDDYVIARLNYNELLVVGVSLGAIFFIIILGAYFFFRNICCRTDKKYTAYNALLDGDEDQRLRLTYSENTAVAYRREIDSIINDDSSSISCSEDEEDVLQRVINR